MAAIDPSLDDFVKFKPLTQLDSSALAATFEHMSQSLTGSTLSGTARFRLLAGEREHVFSIVMHEGSARLEAHTKERADFEIITTPETWLAIAGGSLAPLDAFTRGQLRVRGDIALGQRIMKRLAAQPGRVDFC
jgi:putative sterol carrier protein